MILGGYGNFGKRIAEALTKQNFPVIIVGRSEKKAKHLQKKLSNNLAEIASFDVHKQLNENLTVHKPAVLINTCGPFQNCDYKIAEICIQHGIHYIDLADAREFVTGITQLNEQAKQKNVAIISGASTVPGLSSAVLDKYKSEFSQIDFLKFGISPGQKVERGLATAESIFTYVGKPLKTFPSRKKVVYGWQDIYRQDYPEVGKRWMANCDIPDLDLLPKYYNIKTIQFSAGLELAFMHLGLWGLSCLIRFGLPLNLPKYTKLFLSISNWFNAFGSDIGGMHIIMIGKDHNFQPVERKWFIIARNSHGPHIPTIPAIVLAKKLINQETMLSGALPCIGLITLEEYLQELQDYDIKTF